MPVWWKPVDFHKGYGLNFFYYHYINMLMIHFRSLKYALCLKIILPAHVH